MLLEPGASALDHKLERSRFFEEMGGARHDVETGGASQALQGSAVQFDDLIVPSADDEQRRRVHLLQRRPGEVWPAAARDDRRDARGLPRCGDQSRRRPRARAEEADAQALRLLRAGGPADGLLHPRPEQGNVEYVAPV
jgi:hypothetical protein